MTFYPPEVIQKAKQIDLYTYLKEQEPYELLHFSGNTYMTRTHDSLKISNGKWMWWSRGIGGKSALDYLIKVRGETFLSAMDILTSGSISYNISSSPTVEKPRQIKLLLPLKNETNDKVFEYLLSRGIDYDIIQDCINQGILFESLPSHNVVFVGLDSKGTPRYAAYRGTGDKRFMGDASGSDKTYSFRLICKTSIFLHLFESAIDLLSYATLMKMNGQNYRNTNLLSLAGVYQPNKDKSKVKIPKALDHFLNENDSITQIIFHLDNDYAGRNATQAIRSVLSPKYKSKTATPPQGKDVNDYLCSVLGLNTQTKITERMDLL